MKRRSAQASSMQPAFVTVVVATATAVAERPRETEAEWGIRVGS